jgi:hypothetical protein
VAHPAYAIIAKSLEKVGMLVEVNNGPPVLLHWRTLDLSSKCVDHKLEPIANAKHWQIEIEQFFLAPRRVRVADARRAA